MPTVTADGIYYVDLGSDPTFADGSFISMYPENLEFDDAIRDAGNISFEISYSATDQDGNIVVTPPPPPDYVPFIGPYRSYYRLRCGNIALMAGVITSTSTTLGSDFMTVTGKTWEHIYDRWQYPFDGRPDHVNDYVFPNSFQNDEISGTGVQTPTGLVYQAYQRDVISIWSDIMSEMMNAVPYRLFFDISELAGLSSIKTNYQLSLGDQTTLLSLINSLATTGEGFDWWVGWDMQVHWAAPYRYGSTASPNIIYFITSADLASGFLDDMSFTNNGPEATHVLGTGAGLASQTTLGRAYGYGPAQVQFTRLDGSYDFGDVRNVAQLAAKTHKQLALAMQPAHEIPFTVNPANYSGGDMAFWSTWRKGRACWITMDMGYHHIDSAQQLKSYQAKMSDEGDVTVDWTLDQIYDTDPNIGTAEG